MQHSKSKTEKEKYSRQEPKHGKHYVLFIDPLHVYEKKTFTERKSSRKQQLIELFYGIETSVKVTELRKQLNILIPTKNKQFGAT